MKNDYIEYWKSCIKHQNDFPELVFPVLGGGEVATSSKFRFGKPRLLFFKIEPYYNFKHPDQNRKTLNLSRLKTI